MLSYFETSTHAYKWCQSISANRGVHFSITAAKWEVKAPEVKAFWSKLSSVVENDSIKWATGLTPVLFCSLESDQSEAFRLYGLVLNCTCGCIRNKTNDQTNSRVLYFTPDWTAKSTSQPENQTLQRAERGDWFLKWVLCLTNWNWKLLHIRANLLLCYISTLTRAQTNSNTCYVMPSFGEN